MWWNVMIVITSCFALFIAATLVVMHSVVLYYCTESVSKVLRDWLDYRSFRNGWRQSVTGAWSSKTQRNSNATGNRYGWIKLFIYGVHFKSNVATLAWQNQNLDFYPSEICEGDRSSAAWRTRPGWEASHQCFVWTTIAVRGVYIPIYHSDIAAGV